MLTDLNNTVGKVFIYHNNINKSGVNMISSILKENGYIELNDTPNSSTRCSICKKFYNDKHVNHEFQALRFILYTGQSLVLNQVCSPTCPLQHALPRSVQHELQAKVRRLCLDSIGKALLIQAV